MECMYSILYVICSAEIKKHNYSNKYNTEKTTTIKRTAVRETAISRHPEGPIVGTLKILRTSQHYHIEGFKEALNWAPLCRWTLVSRNKCEFFKSGL